MLVTNLNILLKATFFHIKLKVAMGRKEVLELLRISLELHMNDFYAFYAIFNKSIAIMRKEIKQRSQIINKLPGNQKIQPKKIYMYC